ncbi:hypothetical protein [Streptomyces sp. NPDC001137]|uniref:RraA family protein n=1 Tax=Streptomyces sp. NPDC001137 TaxID=3154378 RepID=UPI00331A358F
MGVKSDDARGKVLVLASNGHRDVLIGGGTNLSLLARYGLAGVLTDAWLRDFAQLRSYPFAAYCSAEAVRWVGAVITPYQANVPIVVTGVGVHPGQCVFADDSGAVVSPEPDIDAVLDGAVTVGKEEAAFRAQAEQERTSGGAGIEGQRER